MRPVSDAFLRTVRGSHDMAVRALVCTTFQTGVSPSGTEIPVADGSVTLDSTADVMGSLDLTTDGNGWDTRPGRHLVQPYGNEIWAARGIVVNGSVEWVSQGFFRITEVEQDTAPDGQLQVTGADRMQGIIDAQIIRPVQFLATDSVAAVFSELVTAVYPAATIEYDWDASSDLLGAQQVTDTDRHGFLADLATSRGKIMYWDYRGVLVLKDRPGLAAPVWTVDAGRSGVLITAQRTLTRDDVYNAVAVTADGADTSAAPLTVAYDSNPASPTYFYGPFGQVPEFWSSPTVTTADQAAAAAASLLSKAISLPLQDDFTAVPNPALEPLDTVTVDYGGDSSPDLMAIDSLVVPLTASDAMSGTAHDPSAITIGFG